MGTSFHKAIAISIFIHLCFSGALYRYNDKPIEHEETAQKIRPIEITLSKPEPQLSPVKDEDAEVELTAEVEEIETAVDNEPQPAQASKNILLDEALDSSLAESGSTPSAENIPLTAASITTAIANYNEGRKAIINRQWLEECLKYKTRHGSKTCPQEEGRNFAPDSSIGLAVKELFQDIVQVKNYQLIEKYENENKYIMPLMKQNGVAGEVAKIRYDLNLENIKYLQKEFSTDIDSVTGIGTATITARICNPMPCVFKYSKFEIKKTDSWDEENEPEFKLETPLFLPK